MRARYSQSSRLEAADLARRSVRCCCSGAGLTHVPRRGVQPAAHALSSCSAGRHHHAEAHIISQRVNASQDGENKRSPVTSGQHAHGEPHHGSTARTHEVHAAPLTVPSANHARRHDEAMLTRPQPAARRLPDTFSLVFHQSRPLAGVSQGRP